MKYLFNSILILIVFVNSLLYSQIEKNTNNYDTFGVFDNIFVNTSHSFTFYNMMFHLGGAVFTYIAVNEDIDYTVHTYAAEHKNLENWFNPVRITGVAIPFSIAGVLFLYGKFEYDTKILRASYSMLQSIIITWGYISLLKVITGRPFPDREHYSGRRALSKTFNWLKGKITYGWPSGHTGVMVGSLTALMTYYHDNLLLKIGSIVAIGYTIIGVSMASQGQMHWFSDGIAATFMAYAIGHTVGEYYRDEVANKYFHKKDKLQVQLFPIINIAYLGLSCKYTF